ncbi:MAG: ParB N-terminal domain-containing protein [Treponema sp.]|nr:ParB N-terminal domain-containing protein [Treponema sp.]
MRKIALSQIVDTGNVSIDYSDIAELVKNIKKNGQLEPVLVKALEPDADGIEKYELVDGHCRCHVLQSLVDAGENFKTLTPL